MQGLFTNAEYYIDLNQQKGVHIHARKTPNGVKVVDKTYSQAKILENGQIFDADVANQNRLQQLLSGSFENSVSSGKIIRPSLIVNADKLKNDQSFAIIACTPSCYSSGTRKEETGVHWHTYRNSTGEVVQDFTAKEIILTGQRITETMTTNLALQRDLKDTKNLTVGTLKCNSCKTPILSQDNKAFENSTDHTCQNCGTNHFSDIPCVSNPIISIFNQFI